MPPVSTEPAAPASRAKLITVIQRKGGVGKTTITVNLAAVEGQNNIPAPDEDAPVVAVGIDPQGSLEQWTRRVDEDALPYDYVITKGRLGELPKLLEDPVVRRAIADTPGFLETEEDGERDADPLGKGPAADAMREVLQYTDLALVPIEPDFLSKDPAEFTIERVLKPRGIPFMVVINKWDPRSEGDLEKVQRWCQERGYPYAPQAIRAYRIHAHAAENGLTVIQYKESGSALRAREDFYKLGLAVEQAL